MDWFKLLCVSENNNAFGDLAMFAIPTISTLLLLYGIILICESIRRKEEKYIRKLKRGGIVLSISIVLIVISIFIMNANVDSLHDACGHTSPLYNVTKALFNIEKILVPVTFIIISFCTLIRWVLCEDKNVKKELGQKIKRYLIIAVAIFVIMTFIDALIGVFVDMPDSTSPWIKCWC